MLLGKEPRSSPGAAKSRPRAAQEKPRSSQEQPDTAQEQLRTRPGAARSSQSSPGAPRSSPRADSILSAPTGVRYLLAHILATGSVIIIPCSASALTKRYGDSSTYNAVANRPPWSLYNSAAVIHPKRPLRWNSGHTGAPARPPRSEEASIWINFDENPGPATHRDLLKKRIFAQILRRLPPPSPEANLDVLVAGRGGAQK